jgi:hypothetical protein
MQNIHHLPVDAINIFRDKFGIEIGNPDTQPFTHYAVDGHPGPPKVGLPKIISQNNIVSFKKFLTRKISADMIPAAGLGQFTLNK